MEGEATVIPPEHRGRSTACHKLSSAEEAVKQIKDGDTVAFNGFAFGFGFAEEIAKALGKRYEEEGHPKELTLLFEIGLRRRRSP